MTNFEVRQPKLPISCFPVDVRGKVNKLQIVFEKKRMGIMTYEQRLIFNVISIQI
jgi:hypothetical protein